MATFTWAVFAALVSLIFSANAQSGNSSYSANLTSLYAPKSRSCPSEVEWLRPATNLSADEASWLLGRKAVVAKGLEKYLRNLNLSSFPVDKYIVAIRANTSLSNVPIVSLAISGGGALASFTGVGLIQALDDRFAPAVEQRTGGILQTLTYLAGLSGGSWPVTGYSVAGFPTSASMLEQWQPSINPLARGNNATQVSDYLDGLYEDLAAKAKEGFGVSMCDLLGRAIASEVIPGPDYGANVTWSGISQLPEFQSYDMPMPLVELLIVSPYSPSFNGSPIPLSNSSLVEATPFEFGSWQGATTGFTPTKHLGTVLKGGVPANLSACVEGFDAAGFILGSSSCGWNFWFLESSTNDTLGKFAKRSLPSSPSSHVLALLKKMSKGKRADLGFPLSTIGEIAAPFQQLFNLSLSEIFTAPYPNPWLGVDNNTQELVHIVDGSEGGQGIPLPGLIQPERHADFIITWDVMQDTDYSWQNGTNLFNTAAYAKTYNLSFPTIPTAVTMLNRNYTTRPTMYGCNASLASGLENGVTPIVLYMANAPYSAYTNFSFTQLAYTPAQLNDTLLNSFNIVTQGNGTLDSEWPACIGCAMVQRSIERLGWETTDQCKSCFAKYCWDGTNDATLNPELTLFNPSLALAPTESFAAWNASHQYNPTSTTSA